MRRHPRRTASILLAALAALAFTTNARASWRAASDSLYALAERNFVAGNYRRAAELYSKTVSTVVANDGTRDAYLSSLVARSTFLLGRSYEQAGEWDAAIAPYLVALDMLPAVSDATRLRLARCYRERGEFDRSVAAIREVLDDGRRTAFDLAALESLGDSYYEADDGRSALHWYQSMLREASDYEDVARAHLKMGRACERRGQDGAAKASYATAVNEYPRAAAAREALKLGRAVSRSFTDRYHQGLVLYNQGRLRDASEFFTYYLRNEDGKFEAEANYFRGRCHQRTGSMRAAASDYRRVIELGVEGEYADLAWAKFAYCLRTLGKVDESLAAYDRYAALYPEKDGTAHILWEKARLLEEEKRWEEAREEYRGLAERYPATERAGEARFRAGLCLFKLGFHREAEIEFTGLFAHSSGAAAARALYWVGKVQERSGRPDDAAERYRDAALAAKDSFYGRRALERMRALGENGPMGGGRWARDSNDPSIPWSVELTDFAAWLAEWHDRVYFPGVSIALRESLLDDPAFVRADLFARLHMPGPAAQEFAALEASYLSDPRMLDVLIDYYESNSQHRRAIRAAERILAISPASQVSDAPAHLRKKMCPTHWRSAVVRECASRGIDPNLFFSLIRQESLFEVVAQSGPGARGLSQIMPDTGRWIARKLGVKGFDTASLRDPETNIRFGVYYLSVQLEKFDGDVIRALAAYNGGPGNVERWWDFGGTADPDVFFEDIGFAETADYVKRVYLYSQIYRETYGDLGE